MTPRRERPLAPAVCAAPQRRRRRATGGAPKPLPVRPARPVGRTGRLRLRAPRPRKTPLPPRLRQPFSGRLRRRIAPPARGHKRRPHAATRPPRAAGRADRETTAPRTGAGTSIAAAQAATALPRPAASPHSTAGAGPQAAPPRRYPSASRGQSGGPGGNGPAPRGRDEHRFHPGCGSLSPGRLRRRIAPPARPIRNRKISLLRVSAPPVGPFSGPATAAPGRRCGIATSGFLKAANQRSRRKSIADRTTGGRRHRTTSSRPPRFVTARSGTQPRRRNLSRAASALFSPTTTSRTPAWSLFMRCPTPCPPSSPKARGTREIL